MTRHRLTPSLLLVLLLALMPLVTTNAQGTPATPAPGEAPTGVLAEFTIDALPTPHAEVWFMRYGLDPGGTLPAGRQIGGLVVLVESGAVTLTTDQPLTVSTAGEAATPDTAAATPPAGAYETVLRPGESVLVGDGTTLTATNNADEPTTFLVVYAYAAEREGELGEGGSQPAGLTQQAVSIGRAEFPAGSGTLTMERVVVEPGATLENDSGHGMGIGGIDLGAIEQGSAEATFMMGSSWRWPNILNEDNEPQPIDPGATVELTAGDGYWTFDGSSTWTVTGDDPLIVLRVVIMPGS